MVALALISSVTLAQNGVAPAAEAPRLESLDVVLERDMARFAGDPAYDYRLGMALYQAGRAGEALFAFERVVMSAPLTSSAAIGARLNIAQISLERGALTTVREALAPLSAVALDTGQQATLARLRADLDARSVPASGSGISVRGYVLAGVGKDNNVTGGPNLAAILLPGTGTATQPATPTTLGTAAQQADHTRALETGLALRASLGEHTWLAAGGSVRQGFNTSRNDVRDGHISADLGLVQRHGKDFYGASLLAQDYRVAGVTYRQSLGVRANWVHPLNDTTRLTTFGQFLDFRYPANAIDDSSRRTLGANAETTLNGGRSVVSYGLYLGDDRAKDSTKPHFSYRLTGAQLGANYRANDDLTFAVSASVEQRRHLSQDRLHLLLRRDNQFNLATSLDYRLSPNWHLIPLYSYTRNASTTGLYAYSRRAFWMQLRWDFDNEKQ